jgi:hypothetical protein
MLCYKDKEFCSRNCANKECKANQINIDIKHKDMVGLPLCTRFFANCDGYIEPSDIKLNIKQVVQ